MIMMILMVMLLISMMTLLEILMMANTMITTHNGNDTSDDVTDEHATKQRIHSQETTRCKSLVGKETNRQTVDSSRHLTRGPEQHRGGERGPRARLRAAASRPRVPLSRRRAWGFRISGLQGLVGF